jgi:hypothetical protein
MARVDSLTTDGINALFAAKTADDATKWGTKADTAANTANISAQGLTIATHTSDITTAKANIAAAQADIITNQAYSVATRPISCTSTTRPTTNMFLGKRIYETDTKAFGEWDGAAWVMRDTAWQLYTPVWAATGGNPSLGAGGLITGRYFRTGRMCKTFGYIACGTTGLNGGGGIYSLSLPVPYATSNIPNRRIGILQLVYSGSAALYTYSPYLSSLGGTTFQGYGTNGYGGSGSNFTNTSPTTISGGMEIFWDIEYDMA